MINQSHATPQQTEYADKQHNPQGSAEINQEDQRPAMLTNTSAPANTSIFSSSLMKPKERGRGRPPAISKLIQKEGMYSDPRMPTGSRFDET